MSELQIFYNERKLETEQFILLLEKLDVIDEYTNDMAILKSQAILMMYNLIEGTVNKGIEHIFDKISDDGLKHNELSDHIRIMWMRYFKLHLGDKVKDTDRLINFDSFLNDNVEIDMEKFREINPSYFSGGSLDSASIKKILKKFSISFNNLEHKLKEIKIDRNFLAHGEKSFRDVSHEKSVSSIKDNQEKVFVFLENYITEIENYILNGNFKISNN